MDDDRDRLIDVLLREQLGGETPPDLTERVLTRAFPLRQRLVWRGLIAAAAVLLTVGALGYLVWSKSGSGPTYPEPVATGAFEVITGDGVKRGATLRTKEQTAILALGGYSRIELKPGTTVRIEGDPYAEAIALEVGEVMCTINRGVGSFTVGTPFGRVAVAGTQFSVRLTEERGAKETERTIAVQVRSGAVLLDGTWGKARLQADEQRVYRAVGNRQPEARSGTLHGTVLARGEGRGEVFIEVKADGEETARRYTPAWVAGGLDKAMVQTILRTPVGSRVKLEWAFFERFRVVKLEILDGPTRPKETP